MLVDGQLGHLTRLTVDTIPSCHMAEVVVMCDQGPVSSGATEPASDALAALRRLGRCPSIEAWARGEAVQVDAAAPWPEFAEVAEAFGIGATLAVPVTSCDSPVGTLTLYAPTGRTFSSDDAQSAEILAGRAAVLLADLDLKAARTEVRQLQEALRSRATIEQAKGILIALNRCSPDGAFARLVTRSQHENRKLRDVAADLVAQHAATDSPVAVLPLRARTRGQPEPGSSAR